MNRRQAKKNVKKELRRVGIRLPWLHDDPPREVMRKYEAYKRALGNVFDAAIIHGTGSEIYNAAEKEAEYALCRAAFGRYADKILEGEGTWWN